MNISLTEDRVYQI